jgi:Sulfotransferase domain
VFAGRVGDPDPAKAVFRATTRRCAAIPPERLLVFEVRAGWQPLCGFLWVPVPDAPFPSLNDAEQFKALVGG